MFKSRFFCTHYTMGKKRRRWLLVLLVLLLPLLYWLRGYYIEFRDFVLELGVQQVRTYTIQLMNRVVQESLDASAYTYSDFTVMERGENNRITAISLNTVTLNRLRSSLATEIENRLAGLHSAKIGVPVGSLLSQDLFAAAGPKIPVDLMPMGYSLTEVQESFDAAGINQTRHQISLKISSTVAVLMPLGTTRTEVTITVPLAETVIVGEVPQVYASP